MNILEDDIEQLVAVGKKVTFVRYYDNVLWYRTDRGYEFPVYLANTNRRRFLAVEDASEFEQHISDYIAHIEQIRTRINAIMTPSDEELKKQQAAWDDYNALRRSLG